MVVRKAPKFIELLSFKGAPIDGLGQMLDGIDSFYGLISGIEPWTADRIAKDLSP